MNSHYLKGGIGRVLLGLLFVTSVGLASSVAVQAQWPNRDRDYRRDRDDRRDDRYGRNGGGSQIAANDGYQDGLYTGENDSRRGQSYNPERSHFYRNGHGDHGSYSNNGRYGNRYGYEQAYRQGFLRGYEEGFRRYGGNNRGRNNRGNGRLRFPW